MPTFRPAVGPRLKWLLVAVFGLFALLAVNSVYLGAVTFLEWKLGLKDGRSLQGGFYLWNFLVHLVLGFLIVVPTIVFGAIHWRNVSSRPNPRAIAAGIATFVAAIILLATGIALTRVEIAGATVGVREPALRDTIYWLHVIAPFAAVWLFVVHRLSGRRIKWAIGVRWGAVAAAAAAVAVGAHMLAPGEVARVPKSGDAYFEPSLARTASGSFLSAKSLLSNEYCIECHADVVDSWAHSAHATSSFNNPFYAASVRETRQRAFAREGSVQDARFCAGCHDPVPFFSGAFEDPKWDDPAYDAARDVLGGASITCTSCHAITSVDSPRGNADYTIEESPHYPFAFSDSPLLSWVSNQLVKAKPAFHKRTFLKDEVHRSNEFCASCHKVFLPESVNDYKWLRGQDHYGSFLASGRSGHGVLGWYYPEKAATQCNDCHMKPAPSADFAARDRDGTGLRTILSHAFPAANTALENTRAIAEQHAAFNAKTVRVDLFAVREGGAVDGALRVIGADTPVLVAGQRYLVEVVVRTLDIAHEFTQGTADSNEVWLWARAAAGDRLVGLTGGLDAETGALDPWSRTFNAFVIDRDGNRIDRRNPQDIFLPLYNNQIPPGAGDVTHLVLDVPADARAPIDLEVEVRYRKFDAQYVRYVRGDEAVNDLPVLILARDAVRLAVRSNDGALHAAAVADEPIPVWQRWYDYGIGLFRESDRGAGRGSLRQADEAFAKLEELDPSMGALARARLAVKEGRLEDAARFLAKASGAAPKAPWTLAYFTALVDKQNGNFVKAIEGFRRVLASDFATARERGFDFSQDQRIWNELAETLLEARQPAEAKAALERTLAIDPDQAQAWWLMNRALEALGDPTGAEAARTRHAALKPDENARDRAARLAREKYPWANAAAEATVLYRFTPDTTFTGDLRPGTRVEVPGLRPKSGAE